MSWTRPLKCCYLAVIGYASPPCSIVFKRTWNMTKLKTIELSCYWNNLIYFKDGQLLLLLYWCTLVIVWYVLITSKPCIRKGIMAHMHQQLLEMLAGFSKLMLTVLLSRTEATRVSISLAHTNSQSCSGSAKVKPLWSFFCKYLWDTVKEIVGTVGIFTVPIDVGVRNIFHFKCVWVAWVACWYM